jgi:hypothetical protein
MFMPAEIENNMFAPCGMNCMVCYVHLKNKKPCCGCLNDDLNKPDRCKNCEIKNCSGDRGHVYCFNCAEFPCMRIKNLDKSYIKRYQVSLIDNGNIVKNKGLGLFLKSERVNWLCRNCDGVISLHDKVCSECGEIS